MNRRLFILKSLLASIPGFAWVGGKAAEANWKKMDPLYFIGSKGTVFECTDGGVCEPKTDAPCWESKGTNSTTLPSRMAGLSITYENTSQTPLAIWERESRAMVTFLQPGYEVVCRCVAFGDKGSPRYKEVWLVSPWTKLPAGPVESGLSLTAPVLMTNKSYAWRDGHLVPDAP